MDSESKLILSLISEMISLLNSKVEDPGRPSKFLSLASELISRVRSSESESESELITLIKKIIFVGNSMSESGPESQLVSQVTQMISIISSEEWDSKKEPEPELISLTGQMLISFVGAMENSESELVSLINQIDGLVDAEELRERESNLTGSQRTEQESKVISFSDSMYLEAELVYVISEMISVLNDAERQSYFIALTSQLIHLVSSDSDPKLITSRFQKIIPLIKSPSDSDSQLVTHVTQMISIISSEDWNPKESKAELISRIHQIVSIFRTMDPDSELVSLITEIVDIAEADKQREPESKLISFITQLMFHTNSWRFDPETDVKVASLISRIISLVNSMEPKQEESELMSLVNQTISLFHSMDLDSQPKPLKMLISLVSLHFSVVNSSTESESEYSHSSHFEDSLRLAPEPEIISLIYQIFSLVFSMNPNWGKLICVSPQIDVILRDGKFQVSRRVTWRTYSWKGFPLKWDCLPVNWNLLESPGTEDITHFRCRGCNGENHGEYSKAPVEVKHPLHPKHSLQLVALKPGSSKTRECYCCDDDLETVFYYCLSCDYAMNVACLEKPPLLHRDPPRWHEHRLALFPRQAFLTCNLCALADESSPIYMCPPCDFVVHQKCLNLPRVIRISRHRHRISFTPSFDQGDWFCGVCRRKIDNDYGGYSCIKDGCLYAAHSKCATQRNVWDGLELEGEPEEVEEDEFPPFVTISDGIIQHFSHQQHHLRLDDNTSRDYDEDKLCRACTMPIYYGNFYSCIQCDYILHEACANLSGKMHHSIHPHLLTLVNYDDGVVDITKKCSACPWACPTGFFYECGEEKCDFRLHVRCAIISEPLVHESHIHPLFLTSKPETWKDCGVCKKSNRSLTNEKFNCLECDFSLCFRCATLPQKLRYKYDKHMLTLSYGDETSTMTYWCEACEKEINLKKRFYMCDEYCCVTLHIKCMLGVDLYIKPGSSWLSYFGKRMHALPNNHHMSRPKCFTCEKRCPYKIFYKFDEEIFCSHKCWEKYRY